MINESLIWRKVRYYFLLHLPFMLLLPHPRPYQSCHLRHLIPKALDDKWLCCCRPLLIQICSTLDLFSFTFYCNKYFYELYHFRFSIMRFCKMVTFDACWRRAHSFQDIRGFQGSSYPSATFSCIYLWAHIDFWCFSCSASYIFRHLNLPRPTIFLVGSILLVYRQIQHHLV